MNYAPYVNAAGRTSTFITINNLKFQAWNYSWTVRQKKRIPN